MFSLPSFSALIPPLLAGSTAISLWRAEKKYPLRFNVENSFHHDTRNLVMAATSALCLQLSERPLSRWALEFTGKKGLGLLRIFRLSAGLEAFLGIILLDYTLYLWHVLTHKISFLWRFHEVHHIDRDLTASTAIRFHGGEMVISSLWRAAQILLLGVSGRTLKLWQQLTLIEIIFHHSNLKLPVQFERLLSLIIVTPRMHAIHHSTRKAETDSNWSSGLSLWDYLHGTMKRDVPQNSVRIGVPGVGKKHELRVLSLLAMPFRKKERSSWATSLEVDRSSSLDPTCLQWFSPAS